MKLLTYNGEVRNKWSSTSTRPIISWHVHYDAQYDVHIPPRHLSVLRNRRRKLTKFPVYIDVHDNTFRFSCTCYRIRENPEDMSMVTGQWSTPEVPLFHAVRSRNKISKVNFRGLVTLCILKDGPVASQGHATLHLLLARRSSPRCVNT
jgi:hypothetical protein